MLAENHTIRGVEDLPLILTLNAGGEPLGWVNYERYAFYYTKDKILWSLGQVEYILRGGINSKTGQQSTLVIDSIVAIDNGVSPTKYRHPHPRLTNPALFERDMKLCAYCGEQYKKSMLTRDHVTPRSIGGSDIWENVVTACKRCNQKKDARLPEEANMPLLYVPYAPSYNEHLILMNKRILADQMQFLMEGVSKHSRLHQLYENGDIN